MGSGLSAAILGWAFTYYNGQVQDQRKARLERVNTQLKDLYGPLLACVATTKSAYEAMVRQHSPDGTRQGLQVALAGQQAAAARAYRQWMTSVLQPINERASAIVQGGFSLLEGHAMEPLLLQLVAHVSASRVVLERWSQGELATNSAISYPDKLEGHLRRSFARLKGRQAKLLGLPRGHPQYKVSNALELYTPMAGSMNAGIRNSTKWQQPVEVQVQVPSKGAGVDGERNTGMPASALDHPVASEQDQGSDISSGTAARQTVGQAVTSAAGQDNGSQRELEPGAKAVPSPDMGGWDGSAAPLHRLGGFAVQVKPGWPSWGRPIPPEQDQLKELPKQAHDISEWGPRSWTKLVRRSKL